MLVLSAVVLLNFFSASIFRCKTHNKTRQQTMLSVVIVLIKQSLYKQTNKNNIFPIVYQNSL